MFDFLRACVEARLNIFVSGGTGSGKTTFLNVLSSFIPEDERILTIEDSLELGIDRFYLGKVGTGILKLITLGGFGIWWIIDIILTIAGAATDKEGRVVKNT